MSCSSGALDFHSLFALAAVWDVWRDPEGERRHSFAVVTTTPNDLVATSHNRMPVILPEEDWSAWLDPQTTSDAAYSLLRPYSASEMVSFRVSTQVNSVRNDGKELVEPFVEQLPG